MTMGEWPLVIASTFAALVFALHPLRVEVLSSITNRKELLATFFFPLTIWFYLRGKIKPAFFFNFSVDEQGRSIALPMHQDTLSRH
jgi:hypothetical protein